MISRRETSSISERWVDLRATIFIRYVNTWSRRSHSSSRYAVAGLGSVFRQVSEVLALVPPVDLWMSPMLACLAKWESLASLYFYCLRWRCCQCSCYCQGRRRIGYAMTVSGREHSSCELGYIWWMREWEFTQMINIGRIQRVFLVLMGGSFFDILIRSWVLGFLYPVPPVWMASIISHYSIPWMLDKTDHQHPVGEVRNLEWTVDGYKYCLRLVLHIFPPIISLLGTRRKCPAVDVAVS